MISQIIANNITKLRSKPFLILHGKTLTYSDIKNLSLQIEIKIPSNSCVGIMIANPMLMIPAILACWRKKSVPAILDPAIKYDKYLVIKDLTNICAILTDADLSANFASEKQIKIEAISFDDSENKDFEIDFFDSSIALLLFTSGSTGIPKCVPLSLSNIWSNVEDFCNILDINDNDVFLSTSPLFYAHALYNSFLTALLLGSTVVYAGVLNLMNTVSTLKMARENKATIFHLTPSMMQILLMISGRMKEPFPKFRHIICGTAKLDAALKEKFEKAFNCVVTQQYGMTETLFISVNACKQLTSPLSVGIPVACEIRIFGPDRTPLAKNFEGEIAVKSKSSFGAYFNQPEETALSYSDGWFFTGDIGFLDDDGYLTITGRSKEMIKKGGININPHEINDIVRSIQGVNDCATVSLPDPIYGEEIYSLVSGAGIDEEKILRHCQEKLPKSHVPKKIFMVHELPKTPNGKTDLAEVKRHVQMKLHTATRSCAVMGG